MTLTMAKHLFMYVMSMGGAWRKHLQNKKGKKVPRERKQQVKVLWVILDQWGWSFMGEGQSDHQSQPGSRLCVCVEERTWREQHDSQRYPRYQR